MNGLRALLVGFSVLTCAVWGGSALFSGEVTAEEGRSAGQYMQDAQSLFNAGQYFKAARYAFAASEADSTLQADAYSWVTVSLVRARLFNAASYFFIRTLQLGNKFATRRALTVSQDLLIRIGPDLLRTYMVRHTAYEDYDATNRNAYLYSLGKDALLSDRAEKAVGYLSAVQPGSPMWAFALQLRGSAHAILGKNEQSKADFRACADKAKDIPGNFKSADPRRARQAAREAEDLAARCIAGEARTLYQMERFEEADVVYDRIPKKSLVWPDILFEQAWNSFGRNQYNRTLGKLVSYKSPALGFVFNTEVDVLRAQSYLALCLFSDANDVINEFHASYLKVGEDVKEFVERNSSNLGVFYEFGKKAFRDSLYTKNGMHRMANRFVRGPYFQNLMLTEEELNGEINVAAKFGAMLPGVEGKKGQGFQGFIEQVLNWRLSTIRSLGGAFVKNSLYDYHAALISDFEKIAFIKLEMLKQAKERLLYKRAIQSDRSRGNILPERRDYQYYWGFNGEFWNDELGDYVFGLESDCGRSGDGV